MLESYVQKLLLEQELFVKPIDIVKNPPPFTFVSHGLEVERLLDLMLSSTGTDYGNAFEPIAAKIIEKITGKPTRDLNSAEDGETVFADVFLTATQANQKVTNTIGQKIGLCKDVMITSKMSLTPMTISLPNTLSKIIDLAKSTYKDDPNIGATNALDYLLVRVGGVFAGTREEPLELVEYPDNYIPTAEAVVFLPRDYAANAVICRVNSTNLAIKNNDYNNGNLDKFVRRLVAPDAKGHYASRTDPLIAHLQAVIIHLASNAPPADIQLKLKGKGSQFLKATPSSNQIISYVQDVLNPAGSQVLTKLQLNPVPSTSTGGIAARFKDITSSVSPSAVTMPRVAHDQSALAVIAQNGSLADPNYWIQLVADAKTKYKDNLINYVNSTLRPVLTANRRANKKIYPYFLQGNTYTPVSNLSAGYFNASNSLDIPAAVAAGLPAVTLMDHTAAVNFVIAKLNAVIDAEISRAADLPNDWSAQRLYDTYYNHGFTTAAQTRQFQERELEPLEVSGLNVQPFTLNDSADSLMLFLLKNPTSTIDPSYTPELTNNLTDLIPSGFVTFEQALFTNSGVMQQGVNHEWVGGNQGIGFTVGMADSTIRDEVTAQSTTAIALEIQAKAYGQKQDTSRPETSAISAARPPAGETAKEMRARKKAEHEARIAEIRAKLESELVNTDPDTSEMLRLVLNEMLIVLKETGIIPIRLMLLFAKDVLSAQFKRLKNKFLGKFRGLFGSKNESLFRGRIQDKFIDVLIEYRPDLAYELIDSLFDHIEKLIERSKTQTVEQNRLMFRDELIKHIPIRGNLLTTKEKTTFGNEPATIQTLDTNETNESRLYESILLDLMETSEKKQREAQQQKKIKLTKRQLKSLIRRQLK